MISGKRVYLAGPIRGLSYGDSVDWREYAKGELSKFGIVGVSPMRFKEFLKGIEKITDDRDFSDNIQRALAGQRGITVRDRMDATNCDLILSNLLGAKDVSIGTMIEYGWSDAFRIPMITVMEKKGNVHEHLIVNEITSFRVETLDEGLHIARAILAY